MANGNKRHWDDIREWEAWRQNGVGFREEYADGQVKGASPRERWLHWDRYAMIEARVVLLGEYPYDLCQPTEPGSPAFEIVGHGQEQQKRVHTFDCDAKRLELEYPDELPNGIFEFDPPPGADITDLRETRDGGRWYVYPGD